MVLQKLSRPTSVEALPHLLGGVDDVGELDVRRGIEIEDQPARRIVAVRGAIPGMQLDAADLRDRGEPLDAIDLQIGLAVAETFASSSRFDVPCMAWRWKNCSPPMPSGARMIEQGRPLICSIIQAPTASK